MLVPIIILIASIAASFALRKLLLKVIEKEFTFGNACLFILTTFALSASLYFAMVQLLHIHPVLAVACLTIFILL